MFLYSIQKLYPRFINFNVFRGHFMCGDYNINCQRKLTSSTDLTPVKMVFLSLKSGSQAVKKVPVIVMHGLLASKTSWKNLGKMIANETQKEVFLVDARNHGDSPHSDHHTYYHLSEDVKHFMSEHNITKAALIGHDMGGRAMMAFALQYSDKVESLTVVDISPIGIPESMQMMIKALDNLKSMKPFLEKTLASAQKIVENLINKTTGNKDLSQLLATNLSEKDSKTFRWKINLESLIKNYSPHMTEFPIKSGEFNGPVMFICGGNSDYVNLNDVEPIKKFFPKATFEVIDKTGHYLYNQEPKKFADITCRFIKSVSS